VLGGTQSLHTNSRDEALALPSEDSVRIALRTQQIIAHESGVTETADPLGGSYYIEALTDRIEKQAMEYIEKIDDLGGMMAAIQDGFPQREIQASAYRYQRAIESNDRIVVGVNKFQIDENPQAELLKVDPLTEEQQVDKLKKLRSERDPSAVDATLSRLHDVCISDDNVMPAIIAAVKSYATLGEICDVMRNVFGEHREVMTL